MALKKFLIPFVLTSLAGHALLLALTTRIDMSGETQPEKVITVELKDARESGSREPPHREKAPPQSMRAAVRFSEDAAELHNPGGPYDAYLRTVRRKIEEIWSYPPEAVSRKREGDAVIRFTIDARGALASCRLLSTSGSPLLDRGTLDVIRTAAPFAPLPEAFNLARLHVTATFSYRLGE
jgi:protein TonB